MAWLEPDKLVAAYEWRYAVKKFDASRALSAEHLLKLEEAMQLAPTSYGLQPWRAFVISDVAVKATLPEISHGQQQPQDCSHFFVLTAQCVFTPADLDAYIDRIVVVRKTPREKLAKFREEIEGTLEEEKGELLRYTSEQAHIALGFLLASAAVLGIDACPMGGLDFAGYDKLLNLKGTGFRSVVGCAVGYRDVADPAASKAKVRFERERLFGHI